MAMLLGMGVGVGERENRAVVDKDLDLHGRVGEMETEEAAVAVSEGPHW